MEGAHGELCARFADGLGRNNAHGFAGVDQMTARQIASVAEGADAALGLTGQGRAHHDRGDALVVDQLGFRFRNEGVFWQQNLLWIVRIMHGIEQDASHDTFGQRGLDVAALLEVGQFNAVHRTAVVFGNNHILHHVHQTAGQVAGVGRFQGRVRQALARAVGGGEVLQNRKTLAEGRGNGRFNDFARGFGHQAAHAGKLAHLILVASRAGIGHHEDGVEALVFLLSARFRVSEHVVRDLLDHFRGNILRGLGPDVHHLVVLFRAGDDAVPVLAFDVVHLGLGFGQDVLFAFGNGQILHADGHAGPGGELVAHVLEPVTENDRGLDAAGTVGGAHQSANGFLGQHGVDMLKGKLRRQNIADQHAARRGLHQFFTFFHAHPDAGMQGDLARVVGGFHLPGRAEGHALALFKAAFHGHVVEAQHNVLRGHDDRAAVGRGQNVVGAHHQHAAFNLGLHGERNMHGHLVAVKVRIVGGADQGMQADGLAFHQQRFKGLNAQTVQRGGAVQQNGIFAHHFRQNVPDHQFLALHHLFGASQVRSR